MTAKTSPADRRPELRAAYLVAFDSFATDPAEVASSLGIDADDARRLLDFLVKSGLVVSDHVVSIGDGKGERVWQAAETYDSISRRTAIRRFDKRFPVGESVEIPEPKPTGRRGATGPRYTEAQIAAGLAARAEGKRNREVAAVAGVKSPNYFAKVLKAREAAAKKTTAKPKRARKLATLPAPRPHRSPAAA